ncbi:sensor histidine kinase [Paenactinomyces guangxiensis]|uniref:histidine kinase n=1 Tax=Paenactinomyces guangxiensis TaxID=1490290 RepID=A0A7W1WRD9_9BACL|nr:HAMP domain-containing sensor histidine kinase [Paenactinomyces guangxiensis]MBA4494661.1 HAMP domain-containing protein [Paenactinomyces guangxiensis]MBH8591745.1 HAMP domain-containing protein [Paenactinomyces guangxiensis]
MKKKFSIRTWFVWIGLPLIFIVPTCITYGEVFVLVSFFDDTDEAVTQLNKQMEADQTWINQNILNQPMKWSDPSWQKTVTSKLEQMKVQIRLLDPKGQLVFANRHHNEQQKVQTNLFEEYPVYQDQQWRGTAYISYQLRARTNNDQRTSATQEILLSFAKFSPVISWLVTFIIMLLTCLWFINQSILKPLASLGKAARMVSRNNLQFHLPGTHIKEVAQVLEAFTAMKKALHASIERQAIIEQERKMFIASMIHDLRTPLFSIRGYLEGIQTGIASTPEKVKHYVQVCQEKANTLDQLVNDLFTYSKLEHLEQSPELQTTDLVDLIRTALEGFDPLARKKNISVSFRHVVDHCMIPGDSHLLARAINNLLDNALRFTSSHIEVGCHYKDENSVQMIISDNGPGFTSQDLPYLFSPLYRAESSRNRNTGGAGLGLAIAKRIVEAHQGKIDAFNRQPGGACFVIELPAERQNEK